VRGVDDYPDSPAKKRECEKSSARKEKQKRRHSDAYLDGKRT